MPQCSCLLWRRHKKKVRWVGRATEFLVPVVQSHSYTLLSRGSQRRKFVFQQAWGLKGTNPNLLRLSSRFILVHLTHTVAFDSTIQTPGFRKVTTFSERLHCVNQTTRWRPGADGVSLL